MTVFFSDIADFTATTDDLESEELTGLLNHYLTEMSKIALEHGATVDKYIGDAIVAFFGDPETRKASREDALACVNMAIAMQRRLRDLQSGVARQRNATTVPDADWRQHGLLHGRQFRQRGSDGLHHHWEPREPGGPAARKSNGEPGGILLSHETYSLVKEAIRAEEQGYSFRSRDFPSRSVTTRSWPNSTTHRRHRSSAKNKTGSESSWTSGSWTKPARSRRSEACCPSSKAKTF